MRASKNLRRTLFKKYWKQIVKDSDFQYVSSVAISGYLFSFSIKMNEDRQTYDFVKCDVRKFMSDNSTNNGKRRIQNEPELIDSYQCKKGSKEFAKMKASLSKLYGFPKEDLSTTINSSVKNFIETIEKQVRLKLFEIVSTKIKDSFKQALQKVVDDYELKILIQKDWDDDEGSREIRIFDRTNFMDLGTMYSDDLFKSLDSGIKISVDL